MRRILVRLNLVVPAVVASGLLGACTKAEAAQTGGPEVALISVRLGEVAKGPIDNPVRATGLFTTKCAWDLSFNVGGILARVEAQKGDRVIRGQVLARLDPTQLMAGERQARAALEKARRDTARMTLLLANDSAPRSAVEDMTTAQTVTEAQFAAAEFNVRHATLVAKDNGWVEERLAEAGETVVPGRPVLRVSGTGRGFIVRAALADRDALGLSKGTPAKVTLDAAPERSLSGRVSEIAQAAARGTGTYQVEVAVNIPSGFSALSGLTAKLEIERKVEAQGAVPLAAVIDGDGQSGAVFVVTNGVAHRVPVRIAALQGDRAILSDGIAGVEQVVTDGAPRLVEGMRVQVLD